MTYYGRDQDIKEHITLKYFLSFNRGNFEIEKYFAPFKVISAFGFLLLICTIIWRNISGSGNETNFGLDDCNE